jgi:PAS domain-containing protein
MPLYNVTKEKLESVPSTSFAEEKMLERKDLQRLLKADISPLGDDLMVIAEEFSNWDDSNRRIDLLCLDKTARLVVVELKRTEDGGYMELQAIRYAAMVSSMTLEQATAAHATMLGGDDAAQRAQKEILEFLELDSIEDAELTNEVRIFLVSANFSPELTTSVLWLNKLDLDITCIRLQPYKKGNEVLIDVTQIIPLPEASKYEVKVKEQGREGKKVRTAREEIFRKYWAQLIERSKPRTQLLANRSTTPGHWLSAGIGRAGFSLNITLTEDRARIECYIRMGKDSDEKNKAEVLLLHLAVQAQGRLRAMFAATLPYTVTDPYRIKQAGTVPPEMFFGRLAERESIIAPQGASFVYGGRQLGKTVLLKEIERLLHDPAAASIVQWVDLPGHGVGRSAPPETLWTIVVRELFRFGAVSIDWPDFRPTEQKHIDRVTEDIRAWLEKHPDGRILLLLDEADEFLREDATEDYPVTRQLKALMERTGGRFKSVFVGLHNVLRSTLAPNNPLVHLGAVEIGPLYAHGESRAAFEMVLGPISALGYVFADDSLIMRILAACNYYPNLINLFCRKLLEKLRDRADAAAIDPSRGYYQITEKLVSEIYESTAVRDDIRHYFLLTLQLDTRYELIANWLAMEYLQKRINSAEGIASLDIRTAARALWPEGFRGTTDQEFDALLMEMVGLGVLRRTEGNQFTFRNPNVLQLMGTSAEIDDRLTKIAVEGELKPGFDATTFRGPMPSTVNDARRSPLTIAQEGQICTPENGVLIICGAALSGLSDVKDVLCHRHAISQIVATSALTLDQAKKDLDSLRGKPKTGINVLLIPETRPWTPDWIVRFHDNLEARVSTTSFIRAVFEAGPELLWSMAKEDTLGKLEMQGLIVLKPWTDPYLWIWLEDMNLPPNKALRKALLEATDGRPGLLMQLHADLDAGPRLNEQIDRFIADLSTPDRASVILTGLGALNEEARKGLSVMKELPGETVTEVERFWPDMGPSEVSVQSFVRWAELLSLVRPVGPERWEVEPFVAKLLAAIAV